MWNHIENKTHLLWTCSLFLHRSNVNFSCAQRYLLPGCSPHNGPPSESHHSWLATPELLLDPWEGMSSDLLSLCVPSDVSLWWIRPSFFHFAMHTRSHTQVLLIWTEISPIYILPPISNSYEEKHFNSFLLLHDKLPQPWQLRVTQIYHLPVSTGLKFEHGMSGFSPQDLAVMKWRCHLGRQSHLGSGFSSEIIDVSRIYLTKAVGWRFHFPLS